MGPVRTDKLDVHTTLFEKKGHLGGLVSMATYLKLPCVSQHYRNKVTHTDIV